MRRIVFLKTSHALLECVIMLLVFFFVTLLGGCKKALLDRDPLSHTRVESSYSDLNSLRSALSGCYDGLQDYRYYGRNYLIIGEILSGNAKLSADNKNYFSAFYNCSFTSYEPEVEGLWKVCYQIVSRANNVIHYASLQKSSAELNQIKGEALALRALVYFDLVRTFAQPYTIKYGVDSADGKGGHIGVPLVVSKVSADSLVLPKRENVRRVYNQIIKDLNEADSLLSSPITPYRFNNMSVKSLLSLVYLSKRDYYKSREYAMKVLESKQYSLLPNGEYEGSWGKEMTSESIFSISNSVSDNPGSNSIGFMLSRDRYGDVVASNDLYILYSSNDVRRKLLRKGTEIFVSKYPGRVVTGLDNIPVIRFSEILMVVAEIYVNSLVSNTNKEIAITLIDSLRVRANPSEVKVLKKFFQNPESVSNTDIKELFLAEFRKELAFEGDYFHMLKRNGITIVKDDCNAGKCTIEFPSKFFELPIPMSEMNANKNMVQNKGY